MRLLLILGELKLPIYINIFLSRIEKIMKVIKTIGNENKTELNTVILDKFLKWWNLKGNKYDYIPWTYDYFY